ncbi:hypothetical protein HAX54_037045 [Datura stramonium]|uniref:Uncharacterized protein n=1 Tax=Datura stramonium TaxID=4076 RepID=A0ABS8VIK5_DATST|nr:hypothetical protein [Datura stramonium]
MLKASTFNSPQLSKITNFEESLRSGGYGVLRNRVPKMEVGVGGFLQLFDWNAKSRKKLLSKSDIPGKMKCSRTMVRTTDSSRAIQTEEEMDWNLPSDWFISISLRTMRMTLASPVSKEAGLWQKRVVPHWVTDEEYYGIKLMGVAKRLFHGIGLLAIL